MTGEFYAQTSVSFSATRMAPWEGWARVLEEAQQLAREDASLRVLDLACGNLRFERYLADAWAGPTHTYAFDSCDELVQACEEAPAGTSYEHLDVLDALMERHDLSALLKVPACDLCVCFGFMHHVPLKEHREQLLRALVSCLRPGGLLAISFWQLSKSERLLRKARSTTKIASAQLNLHDLGPNDYLLGWQDRSDVLRFCHDFDEAELDGLLAAVPDAHEIARFSADGSTDKLNRYLLMCRT